MILLEMQQKERSAKKMWPAYEWEINCFIGMSVLALALIPSVKCKKTAIFSGVVWFLGIALALGRYTALSELIGRLPLISSFRAPVRWGFIAIIRLFRATNSCHPRYDFHGTPNSKKASFTKIDPSRRFGSDSFVCIRITK